MADQKEDSSTRGICNMCTNGKISKKDETKSVKSKVIKRIKDGKLDPKAFGERLEAGWRLTSGLSGFIAGFTYVVSNKVVDYEYEYFAVSGAERKPFYHVMVTLAFVFALLSTFLGIILTGTLSMIGVEHGVLLREKHPLLCDAPEQSLVIAVVFMLIATLFNIGGHSGHISFAILCSVVIIFFIFILWIYLSVLGSAEAIRIMDDFEKKATMEKKDMRPYQLFKYNPAKENDGNKDDGNNNGGGAGTMDEKTKEDGQNMDAGATLCVENHPQHIEKDNDEESQTTNI